MPARPTWISTVIDVANGSLDGEVNSHAAWPNEDGSIVVESEEDFSAWEAFGPPSNLRIDSPFRGDPTIPATAASTAAGDALEANPTGEVGSTDGASVTVTSGNLAGSAYPAIEMSTAPLSPSFGDTGTLTGELAWIGRACTSTTTDVVENADAIDPGDIAVARELETIVDSQQTNTEGGGLRGRLPFRLGRRPLQVAVATPARIE